MGEHRSSKPALPRNGTKDTAGRGPGCIVLASATAKRPESLLRALAKRHAQVRVVSHPASVMAVLASGPYKNVVIDRSGPVPRLQELLGAMSHYYPTVVCWRYEIGDNAKGQLTRWEDTDTAREDTPKHASNSVSVKDATEPCDGLPIDSIAADPPANPATDHHDHGLQYHDDEPWAPPEDQLPEPLISRDELAMLIGPGWGDGDDEDSDLDAQREHDT